MPIPEKYRLQQIASRRAAEREARRDTRLAWFRGVAEIIGWTIAGLLCIGLAFHTFDVRMGRVWWYLGFVVWIGGVSGALLAMYRRGHERGDW